MMGNFKILAKALDEGPQSYNYILTDKQEMFHNQMVCISLNLIWSYIYHKHLNIKHENAKPFYLN